MSVYPSDQRCPRCQYPVNPGATICPNCGQSLPSAQPASGNNPYGVLPAGDPYGNPPSTAYGSSSPINSAPTVQSPLYPQSSGNSGWGSSQSQPPGYIPPPPGYTSTQMATGYGSAPAYPGTTPGYTGSQPQGGFGPPPTYPGNQSQGFGAPPTYPGSQPSPGFPVGFPPSPTPDFQQPQKKSNGPMIAIIVVVVLVLIGGGSAAGYLLTRPKPVITVTSKYTTGTTPVGATDTTLQVTGQKFSGNSSITFLLDGQPAPDNQTFLSDSSGGVTANLKVSKDWAVGQHRLTAKDANDYVTQAETPIQIVQPGEANTPGPNGSPSNSVSFSLNVTITSEVLGTASETLIITGKGDDGGTVCQARDDGKQHFTQPGTLTFSDGNQLDYNEDSTNKCSGTYVGGHLTYTETTIKDVWTFGNTVCNGDPHRAQVIDGTFTDAGTISGSFSGDSFDLDCTYKGNTITINADKGTFTAKLNQ